MGKFGLSYPPWKREIAGSNPASQTLPAIREHSESGRGAVWLAHMSGGHGGAGSNPAARTLGVWLIEEHLENNKHNLLVAESGSRSGSRARAFIGCRFESYRGDCACWHLDR